MPTSSMLLLLADGRFPAGAHAHSGGLEAAVAAGRVTDLGTLGEFLRGRLATAGLVGAAFAAAAHRAVPTADRAAELGRLDAELDARTAAPALRTVSRRQGRALLRAGRAIWPYAPFGDLPGGAAGPHQPLVFGLLAAAAGLSRTETALAAAHGTVTGAASAGVRLLGLDPYHVQALLIALAGACDTTAADAARAADGPPEELPAAAAPLADIHAEAHVTWEVRLFAS
ncbi:urease accessory protein UreF [Micromonospora endolithica]|uniref:Urease accessory protein UreF n=1 Tax=Micromonospora endolithica TaxID=230091 RepID=A0A3A9YWH7_9ACTN|nr:urease accessory UreF family protein [Micromonospora endolithica]RKN39577.1 urease accessory protein UreF [Micromonospora endolithica]TWJ22294.1 urease accessory protein [Micromonospora endolithica]